MTPLYEHIVDNILDGLNEGILDQEGSLIGGDRVVVQDWLDRYVVSKPKIQFLKDGSIKVNGDFVVKGYDGDVFPGIVRINSIINGDIVIEKCPNIESVRGIFDSIKNKTFLGGISVGNCDSLSTLEGLPVMSTRSVKIVGNKSLKSLTGIPHTIGTVYVMKNGKKFTEDEVRRSLGEDSKVVKKIVV